MIDVAMPKWGLTMEEGTVLSWHKQIGDAVRQGDVLVEVESEKTSGEVEVPENGVLAEIIVDEGKTVEVGAVIARIASPEEWADRSK